MNKSKVQVWIYYREPEDGQYEFLTLLTRPERGGFWQPVTGSVEKGETLEAAALREAQEETGLDCVEPPRKVEGPAGKFKFQSRGKTIEEHGFFLSVKLKKKQTLPPPVELDPKEHVGFAWVDASEALRRVGHLSNAQVLEAVLNQLEGKASSRKKKG